MLLRSGKTTLLIITIALCLVGLAAVFMLYEGSTVISSPSAGVRLNEAMASNKGTVPDEHGDYPDWIELHNPTDDALNISGFGLTDDLLVAAKWVFPQGTTIEAGDYLVVFLSGDAEKGPMHASFKISTNEDLVLTNPTGNPVDSVSLTAVASGASLARNSSNIWEENTNPSPGYPNTEEGANAYRESLKVEVVDNGVRINELMASNRTTVSIADGTYPDYIELYNTTGNAVDLSGHGLSDNAAQPLEWVFPENTVIEANSYLLIYCTGQNGLIEGELHAPFGLKAYGETAVLSDTRGAVLDEITYPTLDSDMAFAREIDGTGDFVGTMQPTPGYPNSAEGFAEFSQTIALPKGQLYISEVMTQNTGSYIDDDGATPDWIEIYNASTQAMDISNYVLSDNANNPGKWRFPQGTTIESGEYILVTCSADETTSDDEGQKKNLSANFNLSSDGDIVLLFDPEGGLLDKLTVGKAKPDISYGRTSTTLFYYEESTPGGQNAQGMKGVTSTPVFTTVPGIYDAPMAVEIAASAGETIHYTLDCTTPTTSSPVYTAPIQIGENTVVRAMSVQNGFVDGYSTSGTFLFTTDGVNHELPIATLVTDPDNLWDNEIGIYTFGDEYITDPAAPLGDVLLSANFYEGKESEADQENWERSANFGIFSEEGQEVFSQNVDIRIAGGFGRISAQKGFNVSSSSEYGSNRMEYAFFDERDFTEYHSLTLRAGAQDQSRSKIRDELAAGLLYDTDVRFLYQAYEPYVLYLNGEYWGVYFLREKRNRFFVAQHEGTDNADDMDIVKSETRVSHGTTDAWEEVMAYVRSTDFSIQANYEELSEIIDVYSFMDYIICETYVGNSDYWNIQYYQLPGEKWKWIYYDFCYGFYNVNHETVRLRMESRQPLSDLLNALLENDGWKDEYLRRFAELMDTVFAPEKVNALVDELYGYVAPEIERERAFFNGSTFMGVTQRAEVLASVSGFETHIQRVRDFANDRPDIIKAQLQSTYGLSDSYMQEVFG